MTEEFGDGGDDREYRLCRALEAEELGYVEVEDDDDVDWRTSVGGDDDGDTGIRNPDPIDVTWLLPELDLIHPKVGELTLEVTCPTQSL